MKKKKKFENKNEENETLNVVYAKCILCDMTEIDELN